MIELVHPGVASLILAQPHTNGEIDHEISSLAIPLSGRVFSIYTKLWLTTLSSLPSKHVVYMICVSKSCLLGLDLLKTVCSDTETSVLTGISLVAGYDMIFQIRQ